ncbi:MAG TPA: ankyrin repeat domain-containing protein [Bryobacteraceae bacterium]|nr:ankyrin repeat domain-containing protein [Bryobacteraceae bacterium]
MQSLAHYRKQAEDLVKRRKSGDTAALQLIRENHPRFFRLSDAEIQSGRFTLADAQRVIAREEHFDNWTKFAKHIQALRRPTSTLARFEAAVEAVIKGDLPTLKPLLREQPKLIRERSTRQHRATLLIYVGANGVEGYRQKTPKNAVKVAETLLDAGAEIDAVGKMYRGTTTLGLVATSIHPYLAGVQDDLMDLLLKRGASLEIAVARDYTNGSVVNACLANGRPEAAEFLAKRGARLDLDGAAGVGRLDVVESFFNKDGTLKATTSQKQLIDGFSWACGCGRTAVVDFLLKHGMDVAAPLGRSGTTGLHCAALGGHVETVRLLLDRDAPVNAIETEWNNTPLGWALHSWSESRTRAEREPYYRVVAMLVAAGANVRPAVLEWSIVREDRRMLGALTKRSR